MSVAPIAKAAVTLLAPYLARSGEAIVKKAGEAAWEKAEEIYQALKKRFDKEKDDYSRKTLARFKEKPEARKATFQELLEEFLHKDPEFAKLLLNLLKEADEAGAGATFNVNVFGGKVGEIINIDDLEGGLTINKDK